MSRFHVIHPAISNLDELGYLHLDQRGAELLFQVLTERDERVSIAVASNAPFSEWGRTFSDPRLAGAVVDRLTSRAHILETRLGVVSAQSRPDQAEGSVPWPERTSRSDHQAGPGWGQIR